MFLALSKMPATKISLQNEAHRFVLYEDIRDIQAKVIFAECSDYVWGETTLFVSVNLSSHAVTWA